MRATERQAGQWVEKRETDSIKTRIKIERLNAGRECGKSGREGRCEGADGGVNAQRRGLRDVVSTAAASAVRTADCLG
jgi:hypothetical protein